MIVVVVQYRLGLLGFLKGSAAKTNPPIGGNYAVKDVISALSERRIFSLCVIAQCRQVIAGSLTRSFPFLFSWLYLIGSIREFADTFGGDRDRVTLAGQSSGAEMVKTLLMARSASDLFQRAILHSAPLNYGDHSVKTADAIGSIATSLFNCQDDCYRSSLDVDTILEVQNTLMDQLPNRIPEVAASEPFRPFVDNALITNDFMRALNNPGSKDLFLGNRQIIFTTVKDESAPTIADRAKDIKYLTEIPAFISSALGSLEPNRSSILGSTHVYSKELGFELVFRNRIQAAKETLMLFGSDYVCIGSILLLHFTIASRILIFFPLLADLDLPQSTSSC
jgi:carboxylesterase type B